MKRPILKTITITFLLLLATPVWALSIGDPLPTAVEAVTMKGVDGKGLTLKGFSGEKGTLVYFTCNACPYVKAWEKRMVDIGNEYQKKGFKVIAINANDPQRVEEDGFNQMKERAKARGFEFPYVVDDTSNVARAFDATRTPEVFLFNKEMKLAYHGAVDDNAQKPDEVKQTYLTDALEALRTDKPVKMAETKSVGCSIKFRRLAESKK